jgi:hypothetical protein
VTNRRPMSEVYQPGEKVLLHGDGPYTVAGSHHDENDVLVYALEEMRGYLWPASDVTRYEAPAGPKAEEISPIPTEDTPERLELIEDVAAAIGEEIHAQQRVSHTEGAAEHEAEIILSRLDLGGLARAAIDGIMKRIFADIAGINAVAAKIEEQHKKDFKR